VEVSTAVVLDRFASNLGRHPYCTNDLAYGCHPRIVRIALRYRYIGLNQILVYYLVFDLDYPGAVLAPGDVGLPQPTIMVENPENRHAHVAYELYEPLTATLAGHRAPMRYAASIEAAYSNKLDADRRYAKLLTKNPANQSWIVLISDIRYTLAELADYVDLRSPSKSSLPIVGLGRNCAVFDYVRHWSYRNVGQYSSVESWYQAVLAQVMAANQFPVPLPESEVRSIGRSITKWTWQRRDSLGRRHFLGLPPLPILSAEEHTQAVQDRERIGAVYARGQRKAQAEARYSQVREFDEQGCSPKEIAEKLSISQRWAQKLIAKVRNIPKEITTNASTQQDRKTYLLNTIVAENRRKALQWKAENVPTKEIARRLGVSPKRVRQYLDS